LSLFQISSSWRHVSSWIEWNQTIVSWSITGSGARGLGTKRAIHPSYHFIAGESWATISIDSVLVISRIVATTDLSGLFQTVADKIVLYHEGLLSLHIGAWIRHVSICIQFLVLLSYDF
jgi:hypothetical protein